MSKLTPQCTQYRSNFSLKYTKKQNIENHALQSVGSFQSLSKGQWHFHRTKTNWKDNFQDNWKTCVKTQKTQIAKTILRTKNRAGGIMLPDFSLKSVSSYSHENNMVLAQKQTYRSMKNNREPRNKPMLLQSINRTTKKGGGGAYTTEKRQSFQ